MTRRGCRPRRICGALRVGYVAACGGTFKPALEEQDENGKWVLARGRPAFRGAKMRHSPDKVECQQCGRVA